MLTDSDRAFYRRLRLEGYQGRRYNDGGCHFDGFTGPGHWENIDRWRRTAKTIIGNWHPETVLDVGCGRGTLIRSMREYGVASWGVDLNEDIHTARCAVANGCELPFARTFDVVLALDVIEHVPSEHQGVLLEELRRVTGRKLLATVPVSRMFCYGMADGLKNHYLSMPASAWAMHFRRHGFVTERQGEELAKLGVPFNHGAENYPFEMRRP